PVHRRAAVSNREPRGCSGANSAAPVAGDSRNLTRRGVTRDNRSRISPPRLASHPRRTPSPMPQRRVGLWFIGACGGVASTSALGLAALARGLTPTTGLVTALPEFAGLDLDAPANFVLGGHEVRQATLLSAVRELHARSGV